MKTIHFLFSLVFLSFWALTVSAHAFVGAEQAEPFFVKVAEDVGPAVVSINTVRVRSLSGIRFYAPEGRRDPRLEQFYRQFFQQNPRKEIQKGMGSGVIIDPQGYILTNEHVVSDADGIEVTLSDGRKFEGEVVGTDERSDLAVIRIEGEGLPSAKLGDSSAVKIGQWSIAIGNPFGFIVKNPQPTVTVGVISAVHRSIAPAAAHEGRVYGDLIQTDAAINVGNSGGPLVNLQGEVIGINTLIFTTSGGSQGVGFAVPINRAKAALDYMIRGEAVPYGWLGVWIQPLTESIAQALGLAEPDGAIVFKLVPDGPAARGGLRQGDIVLTLNGEKITDPQDLTDKVTQSKIGEKVLLDVLRFEQGLQVVKMKLEVIIGNSLGTQPKEAPPAATAVDGTRDALRGLVVKNAQDGVEVTKVVPGSVAARSGLRPGDIIEEIARQPVENAAHFRKILKQQTGKILLRTNKGFLVLDE
jgi:serine protease Do